MIDRLVGVLAAGGVEPTPRELRDALWLAEHIAVPDLAVPAAPPQPPAPAVPEPNRPAPPAKPPGERPDRAAPRAGEGELYASGGGTELPGVAARSPAVPALRGKLALVRALRPLKRRVPSRTELVVDEDATAMQIAEEDLWAPVFRPAATRWLNLALVVDAAPSMVVWRRTVAELRALADQLGAFRQVREFTIDSSVDGTTPLAGGHDPATLIDPTGRQTVLVVTDAVGAAWRDGRVDALLRLWGSTSPTAVVTVLPQRMWSGTGLRAVAAELRAPAPGMANREWEHRLRGTAVDGSPIPVLELSPRWLASWAGLVAGGAGWRGAAVVGPAEPTGRQAARAADDPVALVGRFRAAASPTAFRLACYLSAAWLNLPVMRLVQRVMLPESHTAHLAEVFLGGLLRRCDDGSGDPEQVQYEFAGGVREELNGYLLRDDLIEVLRATTEFVADRFGQSFDFAALLADPDGAPLPALGAGSGQPLAYVAATVLAKLGGRYRTLIDRLGELPGPATTSTQVEGPPTDLRFTRDHHWVRVVGAGRVRVGITGFGWGKLGGLSQLQLLEIGTVVTRGQAMAMIEPPGAATAVRSPVSGVVTAVNHPTSLDEDPSGWLIEIDGVDLSELDTLLTLDEYNALTAAPAGAQLPDPAKSRVVLIGYEPVDELRRLRTLLIDEALFGLPADRCELVFAQDAPVVLRAVARAAAEAEDLLLICVSGAGIRDDDFAAMQSSIARSVARSTVLLAERPTITPGSLGAAQFEIQGPREDEILGRVADLLDLGIPDARAVLIADDIIEWGRWTRSTQIHRSAGSSISLVRNRAEGMARMAYLTRLFDVASTTGSARLLDWTISDLRTRTPLQGPPRAEAMALNARCEWELYRHHGGKVDLGTVTATIAEAVREFQLLAESDPPRNRVGLADLLGLQSQALAAGGHGEQALESANTAVMVARSITSGASSAALARSLADYLTFMGQCAAAVERHDIAVSAYGEAVEIYASHQGDPMTAKAGLARGNYQLGELALQRHEYSEARLRYWDSERLWEQLAAASLTDDEALRNLCAVQERLGDVARATGGVAEALSYYESSLAFAEQVADVHADDDDSQRRLRFLHGKVADFRDTHVPARQPAGGTLWPLAKAMAMLPCMASPQDRNFVVRLLADRLGTLLHIEESPRPHTHILNIIEVCDRRPDGLNALLDIVRELDEGSRALHEVERLIAVRAVVPLWPEEEREELFALLRGVFIKDPLALYRQIAGEGAPDLPVEVTYREVFLTLEMLNADSDGLPKSIVFVEHVSRRTRSELAIELRRWADRQAVRLGVITELQRMRRREMTDEPRRNVVEVGGDVRGLVVAGDHNVVNVDEPTMWCGFALDIVGYAARTVRMQTDLAQRLADLVDRVRRRLWRDDADVEVRVEGDSATVLLPAIVNVSRQVHRLIYEVAESHSKDTRRFRGRMRLRMAVAVGLATVRPRVIAGPMIRLHSLAGSRVLRQAMVENEDVDLAVLVEHGVDDTVADYFREIATLTEVVETEPGRTASLMLFRHEADSAARPAD